MREQVDAVQRMQDYIEQHLDSPVTLQQLAKAAGYSPWHATRVFKELVGMPPSEYLRARRLSRAALRLRDTNDRILDVALDSAFGSHEGFTRAFSDRFGLTPERYRLDTPPLALFMPRSARASFLFAMKGAANMTEKADANTVFVQVVERPARQLLLQRGRKATDYWEYCEETGCDVWGVLSSVKGTLYEPVGMWLPDRLRPPDTSVYAQGVELPVEFSGSIPEGMELIDLPPCKYMVFQGSPYKDEEMGQAIGAIWKAIEKYDPEIYGWQWADEDAPRIQLAPIAERGYIEARPVCELKKRSV